MGKFSKINDFFEKYSFKRGIEVTKKFLVDKSTKQFDKWELNHRKQALIFHMFDQLGETAIAVVPITIHLVVCMAIFFQRQSTQPGLQAAGLISAIISLTLFVDGLRVVVMPLGELVGRRMPDKFKLPWVLLVAFCLGILCTYAEPAIASLRPLAQQVKRERAPYLHFVLTEKTEILVLCIGLGVGVAAVLGTIRFVKGWSLKPFIAVTLAPTVAIACYMHWGNQDLRPLLGLCWDSGAVTTGPVTVPVLLSMGIGVMKSVKQKRLAKAVFKKATSTNGGQALEGFGVVTLASILPILAVECMCCVYGGMYTTEDILARPDLSNLPLPVEERSPLQEVVYAIRAILPLIAALMLLVLFVVRDPLPTLTAYTIPAKAFSAASKRFGSKRAGSMRLEGTGRDAAAEVVKDFDKAEAVKALNADTDAVTLDVEKKVEAADAAVKAGEPDELTLAPTAGPPILPGYQPTSEANNVQNATTGSAANNTQNATGPGPVGEAVEGTTSGGPLGEGTSDTNGTVNGAAVNGLQPLEVDAKPVAAAKEAALTVHDDEYDDSVASEFDSDDFDLDEMDEEEEDEDLKQAAADEEEGRKQMDAATKIAALTAPKKHWTQWRHWGLVIGILLALVGMILFNLGLTYGFNALGSQFGELLPAAYLKSETEPKSPWYPRIGGIFLVEIIIFLLGILATRAEPALNVLGRTVEALSGGVFTCKMLIQCVSLGVGVGMAIGAMKILFGVPIMYIILIKYFIVVILTIFSGEDFTNIAWDSAGVTTGPVTVPFVLAIGVGFSRAVDATEGFGILTSSSVAPIISVLLINLIKKPMAEVGSKIKSGAKSAIKKGKGKKDAEEAGPAPELTNQQKEERGLELMLQALKHHDKNRMQGKMVKKKLLEETDSAFQSTDSTPQGVIMRNNELRETRPSDSVARAPSAGQTRFGAP